MKITSPHRKPSRWLQSGITISLLVLIGIMAFAALWRMHRLHNQLIHSDAALTMLETGRNISVELARFIRNSSPDDSPMNWARFSQMIRVFSSIEKQLQFVSLERDDTTVFQAHVDPILPASQPDPADGISPQLVVPDRQMLSVGTNRIPVVTFTLPFSDRSGAPHKLRVGLRKEAMTQNEESALRVIRALLKLTTNTIFAAFSMAILVVLWMDMREEQRDKERRAEEHLAYAGVLASGIAHDFRNPMSSLRLDVQMLRREADKGAAASPERITQLTDRICNITGRMEKVFQEFLFLARPGEPGEQEKCLAGQLLRECAAVAQPRMDAAGVQLEVTCPNEPLPLRAHAESLRRALLNVLINAEQHAGENGRVSARLTRRKATAVIEIANTGTAIPRRDRRRVFDLFYTTRPEGTGLGLFLARAAVEQAGGRIRVTDCRGFAACLQITLPLNNQDEADGPQKSNHSRTADAVPASREV